MNSRKCEIGNVDVHRPSFAKHIRSKKHWEKMTEEDMIIQEWLSKEPIEKNLYT